MTMLITMFITVTLITDITEYVYNCYVYKQTYILQEIALQM